MWPHETWFTEERPPFDWWFALEPVSLAVMAAVLVFALVWRWAAGRLPRPEVPRLAPLGRLSPWVPRLLAVHAGVSLLAQAWTGSYLAPSLHLPGGPAGILLAVLEGLIGVWLVAGVWVRPAAWLLVVSGPLGMPAYGVVPVLERIDLLGIALFLALLPPRNDTLAGAVNAPPERVGRAVLGLRLLVGGSLVILAFTEKLARPDLALAFLDRYPAFNILHLLGWEVGDLAFVRLAGAVELLFGLLIISGALPQLAVIAAGIPFNATLFFLGSAELLGHLPIYGAMLALLVYGSDPRTAPVVPSLGVLRGTGPDPNRMEAS